MEQYLLSLELAQVGCSSGLSKHQAKLEEERPEESQDLIQLLWLVPHQDQSFFLHTMTEQICHNLQQILPKLLKRHGLSRLIKAGSWVGKPTCSGLVSGKLASLLPIRMTTAFAFPQYSFVRRSGSTSSNILVLYPEKPLFRKSTLMHAKLSDQIQGQH